MKKKSITLEVDPTILEKNMRIVKENRVEEEFNKLLADAVPSQVVKPRPGFCVKTFTKPDNKKVFVNVCLTEAIPCPRDISNEELMQILNSEDPSSYRVPMSIGEGRTEPDKSGSPATVYDVAINPDFFSKIEKDDLFQTFFLTVVFEGLQDKYQFELDMQKFTILKNRKSIGTLQSHRIQIRDVKKCEEKTKPLIEEIQKPTLKNTDIPAFKKKEFIYRLRREPPTGEIEYLLAEFMIPASVELKDLNLEVGEDRLVLDSKGLFECVDFFLPCSIDQDVVDAQLNRNKDMKNGIRNHRYKIEEALDTKDLCLGTFIDIEGAFDKTNFNSIRAALCRHNVNPVITNWIHYMLANRVVRLDNSIKQGAIVAKGCPQGGVLSPLLWNLVVNDLISLLNDNRYYTIGYADDLAILVTGKFTSTVCELTQTALNIVEKWCKDYNLTVNPRKTELIMFTNKRALGNYSLPKLFNSTLTLTTEVKYLGITLDSKLNWSKHLDNTLNKASITFWQCRRMIGMKWGLNPKLTLWLYTSVIRPMISYGALVWWRRTLLTTAQSRLQSWQRLVCMAVTGCMRTTPTAALEAMLNLLPLHLFIQQEAATTATRLDSQKLLRKTGTPHTKILTDVAKDIPLMGAPNDGIQIKYIFDKKYKIQLEEDLHEGRDSKDLRIYTDGSKTKSGTGCGIFSDDLNIKTSIPLGTYNSVFQAESLGILEAARTIATKKVEDFSIRILSDSMSVLQALNSNSTTSGLIYECHNALTQVGDRNEITLQWVKGHSNSWGNDRADEFARGGSNMTVLGPEPIVSLPSCWLKGQIRQRAKQQHNRIWSEVADCRQARESLPTIDAKLTNRLIKLNRSQLKQITADLTGHGPYNKHLFNIGITDSPLCRACMGAEETAAHVILYCTGVAAYRAQHLGTPSTLPEIFRRTKRLLKFLEELGWQE